MPSALPLVEDRPGETPSLWSFGGEAGASAAGTPVSVGGNVSAGSGAAGSENAHLWVAGLMLLALGGIVFFHVTGFRGMVDVGVARG